MPFKNLSRRLKRIAMAARTPSPKTLIVSGGSTTELFTERKKNAAQLEKYRIVYDQGGIVTEAINSYPMFITANGWWLDGEDEAQKKMVEDWLINTNFEAVLWNGITDALVFGDAFQEIVMNKGKKPAYLTPRLANKFEILNDTHGNLTGYKQKLSVNGKEHVTDLKPNQILHLQFWQAAGSMYGHGLIHKAYDEILRDTQTAESSTEAIKRHGYKKYHIKVGLEGELIKEEALKAVDAEFKELDSKNEFVTQHDLEISNIDDGGLEQVDTYNDITIMRMSAALGVPEEILGLRRGSTDATATKRIGTYYKKITSMQRLIARCYNVNVIDKITGRPGAVKIVFNDADPTDELAKAKWITQIMKASPEPFAILDKEWVKKQFMIESSTAQASKLEEAKLARYAAETALYQAKTLTEIAIAQKADLEAKEKEEQMELWDVI
jgi:hypothetical protein